MSNKDRTTLVQRLRLYFNADEMRPTQPVMVECIDLEMAADELARLNAQALELCAEISGLRRELGEARALLRVIADIPIQDFGKEGKPDQPLMGWNSHMLHVRDVIAARAFLAATAPPAPPPDSDSRSPPPRQP